MRMIRQMAFVIVVSVVLASLVGCPTTDPRTNNQGGGSVLSVTSKITSGNIGEMNADEWQILLDNAPTLAALVGIQLPQDITISELTDDQAQAIVDLLKANNITTLEQLQQALIDGTLDASDVPPELMDIFTQTA